MISRRNAVTLSAGMGIAAMMSAPASACLTLKREYWTPVKDQIAAIAAQIFSDQESKGIEATDEAWVSLHGFLDTVIARRKEIGAKAIAPRVSKVYEDGPTAVYLVNFHLTGAQKIMITCDDFYENNHAIISFNAGSIVGFQPMPIFNTKEKVRLNG